MVSRRAIHFPSPLSSVESNRRVGSSCGRRCWWAIGRSLPTVARLGGGPFFPAFINFRHLSSILACSVKAFCCSDLTSATTGAMNLWISMTASKNRLLLSPTLFLVIWNILPSIFSFSAMCSSTSPSNFNFLYLPIPTILKKTISITIRNTAEIICILSFASAKQPPIRNDAA